LQQLGFKETAGDLNLIVGQVKEWKILQRWHQTMMPFIFSKPTSHDYEHDIKFVRGAFNPFARCGFHHN
jgi:hypothetical protein